jgi:hypothetical protein
MDKVLDLKHPEGLADTFEDEPVQEISTGGQLPSLLSGPEVVAWKVEHALTDRARMREYMLLAGFLVAGGAVAWWQASWLTFAVIVLGCAAWELHNRYPSPHHVHIDDKGIDVDGYRHRYEHLHSYDLHSMPDGSTHLSIRTTRWHSPHLHISLGEQEVEQVHAVLSRYLAEDDHKIPLMEWWLKR